MFVGSGGVPTPSVQEWKKQQQQKAEEKKDSTQVNTYGGYGPYGGSSGAIKIGDGSLQAYENADDFLYVTFEGRQICLEKEPYRGGHTTYSCEQRDYQRDIVYRYSLIATVNSEGDIIHQTDVKREFVSRTAPDAKIPSDDYSEMLKKNVKIPEYLQDMYPKGKELRARVKISWDANCNMNVRLITSTDHEELDNSILKAANDFANEIKRMNSKSGEVYPDSCTYPVVIKIPKWY